jgi:signal peptidase II
MEEENKKPDESKENPSILVKAEPSKKADKAPYKWTWKSFFTSFAWLGILLFGLDLLSKWLIVWNLPLDSGTKYAVIPGFFYIWPLTNLGSAYGAGSEVPGMRYFYIVISWLASLAIPYFWYKNLKNHDNLINSVFMLCFAGALGNAIDRTFYWPNITGFSGVVDFLSFQFGDWVPFGSFNVADSCLVVGCLMAAITLIVRAIKEKKE